MLLFCALENDISSTAGLAYMAQPSREYVFSYSVVLSYSTLEVSKCFMQNDSYVSEMEMCFLCERRQLLTGTLACKEIRILPGMCQSPEKLTLSDHTFK